MVIGEIKDLATKERLQVLPYELKLKEPSTEAIKFVVVNCTVFAKDNSKDNCMQENGRNIISAPGTFECQRNKATKTRLRVLKVEKQSRGEREIILYFSVTEFSKKTGDFAVLSAVDIQVIALTYQLAVEAGLGSELKQEPKIIKTIQIGSDVGKSSASAANLPGFVTNIKDDIVILLCHPFDNIPEHTIVVKSLGHGKNKSNAELQVKLPEVACLTADFAMQNVLKQIGLAIVSIDGRIIENVRTHILRCYGCFKTTPDMDKIFCPGCGHKTLKRVAATLNEDGSLKIYLSRRKTLTGRGKRFPLPLPKGGKYAKNPILFEDQKEAQKRASKLARQKNNPLDDDYIAGNSPFVIRDVYSKAAILGRQGKEKIEYWERKNPNEVVHRSGRRKRK
nr:EOG090X07WR [Artemia franciscana]